MILVSLFDDYKKIKTFIRNYTDTWYYTNIFYRDRNNLFIKDNKNKWFGTSENLFHEAMHYATKTKTPFDVSNFKKKGTGYVMGTLLEWQKLLPKGEGHLMPFILRKTTSGTIEVGITRNTIFFTSPVKLRLLAY